MTTDSDSLRVFYEEVIRQNANNIPAVYYLAVWHMERHSFQQARRYFDHLCGLKPEDPDVLMCLCVCCALSEEFNESLAALNSAKMFVKSTETDVRIKFCQALLAEKKKDFAAAMEGYTACLNQSSSLISQNQSDKESELDKKSKFTFLKEVRGEVLLRIAMLKKEMGALDQAMQMCDTITSEHFNDSIRANALCLKGLLCEMKSEFPASEVVYRSVLQLRSGHSTALERLGRVYLRYRETIPAAVQCFFKAVETNPSNHTSWYLLGRCYMATAQYSDAYEAYNRAINLNPNDPQIWCSLGVLYYAFGQYRESLGMLSRALRLDPTMADAWYNVGALYDICDQPEDAQQAYDKATEHGLQDRFNKAGGGGSMPLAMQSVNYINSNVAKGSSNPNAAAGAGGAVSRTASSSSAVPVHGAAVAAAAASLRKPDNNMQSYANPQPMGANPMQQQLQHYQMQQQQQHQHHQQQQQQQQQQQFAAQQHQQHQQMLQQYQHQLLSQQQQQQQQVPHQHSSHPHSQLHHQAQHHQQQQLPHQHSQHQYIPQQ